MSKNVQHRWWQRWGHNRSNNAIKCRNRKRSPFLGKGYLVITKNKLVEEKGHEKGPTRRRSKCAQLRWNSNAKQKLFRNQFKFLSKKCEQIAKQVPKQKCYQKEGQGCYNIPRQVPREECTQVAREQCAPILRQVPREVCNQVPREECQQMPSQVPKQVSKRYARIFHNRFLVMFRNKCIPK